MEHKRPSISMDELYYLMREQGVNKSQVLYILGNDFTGQELTKVLLPIDEFFSQNGKSLDIWSIGGVYIRGTCWWIQLSAVYDHIKNFWTYMWKFHWIPDAAEPAEAHHLARCFPGCFLDETANPYELPETFN